MKQEKTDKDLIEDAQDAWWYKIYAAVIVWTVIVIATLWLFSHYFSG